MLIRIAFFFFGLPLFFGCGHPSELELEKDFTIKENNLNELVRMVVEDDGIVTLTENNVFYEDEGSRRLTNKEDRVRLAIVQYYLVMYRVAGTRGADPKRLSSGGFVGSDVGPHRSQRIDSERHIRHCQTPGGR